uniref:Major sperm protein n=1 Tax=Steinernema glaseri TaxID=37863 RepID=A0A1I7YE00_9BILA
MASSPTMPKEMVFPTSSKPSSRMLVLRNRKKHDIVVKIRVSDPSMLTVEPPFDVVRSNETRTISLTYTGGRNSSHPVVEIFARCITPGNEANRRAWVDGKDLKPTQLVACLQLKTSKTFAALETLVDLPGRAIMVESEIHPTMDADDTDTLTARGVDSDTTTAARLRDVDVLALVNDDEVNTARNTKDSSCWLNGWFGGLLNLVFPAADAERSKRERAPPCGGGN